MVSKETSHFLDYKQLSNSLNDVLKPSTVRKYILILENAGYEFMKDPQGRRLFKDSDTAHFRTLVEKKEQGMALEDAAKGIVALVKANQVASDATHDTPSEERAVVPYQAVENDEYDELFSLIERQSEALKAFAEGMNGLQKQNQQMAETLNEVLNKLSQQGEKLDHQEQLAIEYKSRAEEYQQELQEERSKGFFARIFGK